MTETRPPERCTACGQPVKAPSNAHVLRLAKIVAAMAQDTQWHDQMFDLVEDIETLQTAQQEAVHLTPAKRRIINRTSRTER